MSELERRVNEWFETKGVHPNCPQCGGESFNEVGLVTLHSPEPDDSTQGMRGYWVFPIECANCGHFLMFNADRMGLTPER